MGMKILSMGKKQPSISLLTFVLLIIACSSKNLVVLIPDPDGAVGSITISNQAGRIEMFKPNQAAKIKDRDTAPNLPVNMKKNEIDSLFSEALSVQPLPPIYFLLYFDRDSTQLKSGSSGIVTEIIENIRLRDPVDISVVGHADTLGEKDYNLSLSQRRALAVRDLLISRGVKKEVIETTFHGEENLLIKTDDNVGHPKNRRAEVIVR
jgi:outer membrane protein OmpA-like peptidoglycan-associated protein